VIARFEVERQALAVMDHPNIAKVLDAGTTETGRPYFVMELVRGVSISEYCDKNKLDTQERLDLFIQVCNAVQHAHQKGIIHRDIKPSNVMVTLHDGKPVPKVIDFGIAKATSQRLTEKTLFTRFAQIIGTPAYMSPEQAEFSELDIDTRTDIYSLGVLLYELLTGATPFSEERFREAGYLEMQRIICEEEPLKPSTKLSTLGDTLTDVAEQRKASPDSLQKLVRGDLDWIVMKSLEKDRTRRYDAAAELVADIARHLNHEPVLAGPPSQIYRLRKFIRRHRTQAIGAIIVAVLLTGMAVISTMYIQALNLGEETEFLKHKDILSKAMEFRSKGQFQDAFSKVEEVFSSKHVGPEARLLRARLVLELHGPTNAVEELEKLINERDEVACQAHLLLARIYLESAPGIPEKTEEYQQKAKEHQQEGERLFPETAEAYFNQAMVVGTVKKALECLNKAVELKPGHYPFRKARALAHYALRDYRSMERDAVAMTTLRSWESLGYSLLAIALRKTENLVDAMRYHNQAIKISPDEADLYDQRRQTYMKMANYEGGLLDARKSVELEPEKSIYHFHVFCALVGLGRYDEATAEYETIIRSGLMSKRDLDLTAEKYVSDTLDAGLSWYPTQLKPEGAAFLAMHESAEVYHQLAKKAKRVVPEGFHATWSPDGTELAYSRGVLGYSGIEILNLESGKTRLLAVPGHDQAWSPDGQYIVFNRHRQILFLTDFVAERAANFTPLEQREIWITKADGTEEPRFLAKGYWPSWSHDSKQVYYHSIVENKLYSIFIKEGSEPIPVIWCQSTYPALSQDERYIAYGWKSREYKIVVLSTNSVVASWAVPLVTSSGILSWSPDGQKLSMGNYRNSGLWIYDIKAKKASKYLIGPFGWCSWSQPDMSKFAIGRVYGGLYYEIWITESAKLGSGQTIEGHCQEMVDFYTRRINFEPDKAEHYLSRAECYMYLEDQEKFFADMEKYADIVEDPEITERVYADMLWKLVLSTARKGDSTIAVRLAKRAIEMAPENWIYHSTLGAAQYYAGEYEKAIFTLKHSEKMYAAITQESYPRNIAFISMSLHQLGQHQQAEAALTKLRQMFENGRNADLRQYLIKAEQLLAGKDSKIWVAWNCIEAEGLDKALELLSDISSLPLKDDLNFSARVQCVRRYLSWLYCQRSIAQERIEVYDEAIGYYKSAIKADPCNAFAYNHLAWLLATCPEDEFRNGVKAVRNATRACELTNWKNVNHINTLAAAYAEATNFNQAVKWQKKAIDLLVDDQSSKYQRMSEARLKLYQARQTYHRQPLFANQMIAWWTFDKVKSQSVLDSSGNDLNGKIVGDAQIVSDPERGKVLSLEGDGDYVDCGNNPVFDITDKITVAAWVNITTVPKEWTSIVTKGNNAWRLVTEGDHRRFHFAVAYVTTGASWIHGEIEVAANEWHHVCGTYDGANIRLYIDGVEDTASPLAYSDSIGINNQSVLIGANAHLPRHEWDGLIDDVRIYSYALSEAEVKEVYDGRGPGPNEVPK
jgi:serine/threonine protein kinase/Flp pilus assembly protein TadD